MLEVQLLTVEITPPMAQVEVAILVMAVAVVVRREARHTPMAALVVLDTPAGQMAATVVGVVLTQVEVVAGVTAGAVAVHGHTLVMVAVVGLSITVQTSQTG